MHAAPAACAQASLAGSDARVAAQLSKLDAAAVMMLDERQLAQARMPCA